MQNSNRYVYTGLKLLNIMNVALNPNPIDDWQTYFLQKNPHIRIKPTWNSNTKTSPKFRVFYFWHNRISNFWHGNFSHIFELNFSTNFQSYWSIIFWLIEIECNVVLFALDTVSKLFMASEVKTEKKSMRVDGLIEKYFTSFSVDGCVY